MVKNSEQCFMVSSNSKEWGEGNDNTFYRLVYIIFVAELDGGLGHILLKLYNVLPQG